MPGYKSSFPVVDILKYVSGKLDELGIEYFITGSIALMIYGVARQTRDIDIVINLKNNDVDSFLNIFSNDFYLNRDAIKKDISDGIMFNVISETTSYKIDFAIKKNTEFHEAEFLRKKEMKFFDIDIWVVSLEDLIISKLIWIQNFYSELHERDILNVLEDKNVDRQYINH